MNTRKKSLAAATVLAALVGLAPYASAQETPGGDRSMAFQPGLGAAAHEHVPGGRLLVIAYSTVLVLLGGYVVFIARKAARVDGDLRRLEDDLERHRGGR